MNILSQNEIQVQIQRLIDSENGDIGRLRFILEILTKRDMIYNSDKKYLENKFGSKFILKQPEINSKKEENVLKLIPKIMELGLGDPDRLKFIYQTLKKGKSLYKSDQKYLNSKFQIMKNILKKRYQKVGLVSETRVKSYSRLITTEKLDKPSTPKPIIHIIDLNLSELKEIESQGKIVAKLEEQIKSLPEIQAEEAKVAEQIQKEKDKRAEEVKFIEQIKLQASQLKDGIAERDKIAQQTKIVYSMPAEQIQKEKDKRAEEAKFIEQIKLQASQLKDEIAERDKIAQTMIEIVKQKEQIKGQQIKFEEEKKSEKDKLTLVREGQKDIVRQIKHEKLIEQIKLAEKIKKQLDELKKKQSNMKNKT